MCVITLLTFIRDSNITDDDVYIKTSEVAGAPNEDIVQNHLT